MLSFEEFDAVKHVQFHEQATRLLGMKCWVIKNAFTYPLDLGITNLYVVVPKGYLVTESALPVVFKRLLSPTGKYGWARMLHSYLCENAKITNGKSYYVITRERCDGILFQALNALNMGKHAKRTVRLGVDMFRTLTRPPLPTVNEVKREIEEHILFNSFNTGTFELTTAQVEDLKKRYKLK